MPDELTNLLPNERQQALVRDYRFRLGVVAVLLGVVLIVAAAILLVPTYLYLVNEASDKQARLASMASTLSSADEVALSTRLTALSNEANVLTALSSVSSPSDIMRAVLAVPQPGIALSSFIYTPAVGKKAGTLTISGIAATRDVLRSYQLALSSAPFATSANLPVSAYASNADIAFTITITLAPLETKSLTGLAP
jgi:Tfp pilus assembly protein PilN